MALISIRAFWIKFRISCDNGPFSFQKLSNANKLKKEAWQYYQTWMKEKTYCGSLKQEVLITKEGWNHIIKGSSRRRRHVKDLVNKLKLLKAAKYIIKASDQCKVDKRKDGTYIMLEGTVSSMQRQKIRVILKKKEKGDYNFYSVMQSH